MQTAATFSISKERCQLRQRCKRLQSLGCKISFPTFAMLVTKEQRAGFGSASCSAFSSRDINPKEWVASLILWKRAEKALGKVWVSSSAHREEGRTGKRKLFFLYFLPPTAQFGWNRRVTSFPNSLKWGNFAEAPAWTVLCPDIIRSCTRKIKSSSCKRRAMEEWNSRGACSLLTAPCSSNQPIRAAVKPWSSSILLQENQHGAAGRGLCSCRTISAVAPGEEITPFAKAICAGEKGSTSHTSSSANQKGSSINKPEVEEKR